MANPTQPVPEIKLDAFIPAEMAAKAEGVGVKKATGDALQLFALAILAGAFIGLGAIYCTTVLAGTAALPYGVQRLLGGLVFCLGLILVIVGGAELFTGNNLIIMAWANKKISTMQLLRNWGIVYAGNFVGSVATAALVFFSKQYTFGGGAVGLTALNIANSKSALEFVPAVALGMLCNAMVCMAVWLCFSARSTTDKILSIIFPISGFVAAGFEHSIANMYFIPVGLFIKQFDPNVFQLKAFVDAGKTIADYGALTWGNFFIKNLIPVTIGNIIGGAVMVGAIYWFVYLRKSK
ncbi:MAG: putative formate transporter 1 [Chloroflexi bacterium ADurb.Bin360]|nr:MAG: putative formate transporter 1 [Chloroflexi bacterium ADurb.Bin360]